LERARVGQAWRDRWDSFCLVTPNWTMSLPGLADAGDDPEGFVPRDEIVGYLERYASRFGAPVQEGVEVQSPVCAEVQGLRLVSVTALLSASVRDWRPWRLESDHGAWLPSCVAAAERVGNAGPGRPGLLPTMGW
jgi:hypothetical protein